MGPRGVREHVEFVAAIADRDAETAAAIMRAHLERTADRVGTGPRDVEAG
jgi:GntR family transcriptional repressor for pyruvate dehydrogenase complex